MLFSSHGLALSLGKVTLKSAYNEPILAEIPLYQTQGLTKEDIKIALAPEAYFKRVGLKHNAALSELNFEVVIDSSSAFIRITSPEPMDGLYVRFLIIAQWPGGYLLRKYSLPIKSTLDWVKSSLPDVGAEISGNAEIELTAYSSEGQFPQQDYRYNASVALEPEFFWDWNSGNDSLIFHPFFRIDQHDDRRSHNDIREFTWTHARGPWELRAGLHKVFWGVTEFNHLVDIINQTDRVDSFRGESKLGQPMANLSYASDWGIIDAFALLGFRERTFPDEGGRVRSRFPIDTSNPRYESDKEDEHIDLALRWSHTIDIFDFGVYWFDGTLRRPRLEAQTGDDGITTLRPFYIQGQQLGVDLQATDGNWLWKFEGIHQRNSIDKFTALQAGFEYTFYGVRNSTTDIGWLLEYGWDERGRRATQPVQSDIFVGTRVLLNDTDNTTLLLGLRYDTQYYTRSLSLEASRRLNDYWTAALNGLVFQAGDPADPGSAFTKDDHLQLTLKRFF